jgi:hypothetical protein
MDRQLADWKVEIERIWAAAAPDYGEAVRLCSQMANASEEVVLRQAASQALPILRGASLEDADHSIKDAPTREECYRQLLGLPLGRRLSSAEIHRAYKHVAKHAHPDAGGNVKAFLELSAARDALMKEQRVRPRS